MLIHEISVKRINRLFSSYFDVNSSIFCIDQNGIWTKCILFLDIWRVVCPVFCLKLAIFVQNKSLNL